ncbi:MAG: hypothetical protein ACU0BF_04250 [Paracoccaceae bacterium]
MRAIVTRLRQDPAIALTLDWAVLALGIALLGSGVVAMLLWSGLPDAHAALFEALRSRGA